MMGRFRERFVCHGAGPCCAGAGHSARPSCDPPDRQASVCIPRTDIGWAWTCVRGTEAQRRMAAPKAILLRAGKALNMAVMAAHRRRRKIALAEPLRTLAAAGQPDRAPGRRGCPVQAHADHQAIWHSPSRQALHHGCKKYCRSSGCNWSSRRSANLSGPSAIRSSLRSLRPGSSDTSSIVCVSGRAQSLVQAVSPAASCSRAI